jgi:predicted DNA-binding protein (UPF0251 family)
MHTHSPTERVNDVVCRAFSRKAFAGSATFGWATIDDLLQLTHIELLVEFGPEYLQAITFGTIIDRQILKAADRAWESIRSRDKKRRERGLPAVVYSDEVPDVSSIETNSDLRFDIENELRKLTVIDRRIVDAKRQGFSADETAGMVGVSRATVVRTIANVRRRLARVLEMGNLSK